MSRPVGTERVRIEPWSAADEELLVLANAPAMMLHLGGPETPAKLERRHARYLDGWRTGAAHVFRVVVDRSPVDRRPDGRSPDDRGPGEDGADLPPARSAGIVACWRTTWHDEPVFEAGWSVLPGYQGRGIATAATVAAIRATARHRSQPDDRLRRFLHAFPKIENAGSNGVCRSAGLTWAGACEVEYPVGTPIRCNDWFVDLDAVARAAASDLALHPPGQQGTMES
ncbi:GNAT family N-acetyltransferase [Sanguibacter antarcticus]|uniref:Acetyltransferase (GNAT) family protein n=1 Tax=Sanguibacter antarcticus TaxID=372484 RepID=A0A2A9E9B0_9MICO|nr:GNAT family N-acetyltransferase [Sanguibacter antarcticus]PFG34822.1 acetyltransferase (GNAT) family protein [Sanguibacter antarcticus]